MQMRQSPKSRRYARERPQRLQRLMERAANLGFLAALAIWAFVATNLSLLPERHAEEFEEATSFLVRLCRRDYGDVHASGGIDLVVGDLGERHLLLDAEAVVAVAVEAVGGHATEVAHAGQCDVDEAVEEGPHADATQSHAQA